MKNIIERCSKEDFMKQIIVMVAMILLGIAIAGYVSNMSSSVKDISDHASNQIKTITTTGSED